MPELPDVEQFKKYADDKALNQQIQDVDFIDKRMLVSSATTIKKALKNHKFVNSKRLGKYLFLETNDKQHSWLVLHFGMTGELDYFKEEEQPKYSRMLIHFKNGYHLALNDPRLLGKIDLTESPESFQRKKKLGPDAMEIKEKDFVKIFKNKKGMIKPALMDQHLLTGIGNVYADEILFQSKIHPKTKINELNDKKISTLYKKMQFVLKTAIKNEANPEKFPDYFLIPHRHSNQKCTVCDGSVKKIKVGGRGTYYCPKCQVLH